MSTTDLPKRFYKEAAVVEDDAGFGVVLDGKFVRRPSGGVFRAPTRALAKACAAEWNAQGDRVIPARMPITQLAFAALDPTPERRAALLAHVVRYGETDLVCHRADAPAGLVQRQAAAWDELLAWSKAAFDFAPPVVTGVIPAEVPAGTIAVLRAHAEALDAFHLTALAQAAGLAGSAVIALALTQGHIDGATAFAAATIDEVWSLETWGDDAHARARLANLQQDFLALARFIAKLE